MAFTPFTYERQLKFLLDTLRRQLHEVDLTTGSFWQIWAQGQARGLSGVNSALTHGLRQILPDRAVVLDLDHHGAVYDLPRLQPQKATGWVTGTATQEIPLSSPTWGFHLEDSAGRIYDIDDIEDFRVPFAGTFDVSVTAREPGADGNQVTDAPLFFKPETGLPAGMDSEARVLAPGIKGGTDLETDPQLQARIISTLSAGRLKDTAADYQTWGKLAPVLVEDGDRYQVTKVWIYRDETAPDRVYVLPLAAPPLRIGPEGFSQGVFEAVERSAPVTVDPIVPVIRSEEIDVTLFAEPRSRARWDWYGTKQVSDDTGTTDRTVILLRSPNLDPLALPDMDGVDGLKAGMRVLINGEQRQIGHVDHAGDKITLTEDLSSIPDDFTLVHPGGPATAPIQQAVRSLFEVVTPLHKVPVRDLSPQNILASAITDTVMELADVYDVKVDKPEELLRQDLLEDPAYLEGTLAYLATPGAITVRPLTGL